MLIQPQELSRDKNTVRKVGQRGERAYRDDYGSTGKYKPSNTERTTS